MLVFLHRPGRNIVIGATPTGPSADGDPDDMRFLEAAQAQFRRQDSHLEYRESDAEEWRRVSLARLFPYSDPEAWISVADKQGKEIGLLKDLKGLPAETRSLLREELNRRYLMPRIGRILSCRQRYDISRWTVETDRGRITFMTRNIREQVQQPLPRQLILTDVEGNRYEIPDLETLDPLSRRLLDERL